MLLGTNMLTWTSKSHLARDQSLNYLKRYPSSLIFFWTSTKTDFSFFIHNLFDPEIMGNLIDTPSTNQGPTWWVIMNQPGFVGRYVLVQGLEQGKFLQMRIETRHRHLSARSFRVLAFPCPKLKQSKRRHLLELWARTCGDAFLWKPATHHEPAHGPYYPPGALFQSRSLRWADLKWEGCWSLGGCARDQMGPVLLRVWWQWWVGGRWWKKHRATGLAYKV